MTITVSIVSHGHGRMLEPLISALRSFPEVTQIILTYNIPEPMLLVADDRLLVCKNSAPQGFGVNHNAAFTLGRGERFCVLNPDIVFRENPFPALMKALAMPQVSLAVPRVISESGALEDSLRFFLTPARLAKRLIGWDRGAYDFNENAPLIYPDWAAGMFMLFDAKAYQHIGGFDERYFMYCEDADICTRLWAAGYKIVACPSVAVIHLAQRASHRKIKHIMWHLGSLGRYFRRYSRGLPDKNI